MLEIVLTIVSLWYQVFLSLIRTILWSLLANGNHIVLTSSPSLSSCVYKSLLYLRLFSNKHDSIGVKQSTAAEFSTVYCLCEGLLLLWHFSAVTVWMEQHKIVYENVPSRLFAWIYCAKYRRACFSDSEIPLLSHSFRSLILETWFWL
jgi:hypothetical protein